MIAVRSGAYVTLLSVVSLYIISADSKYSIAAGCSKDCHRHSPCLDTGRLLGEAEDLTIWERAEHRAHLIFAQR